MIQCRSHEEGVRVWVSGHVQCSYCAGKKTVSKAVCWSPRCSGVQSLLCLPDESGGVCAPGQVVIEVGGSLHTVPVGDQGLGDCFQKG